MIVVVVSQGIRRLRAVLPRRIMLKPQEPPIFYYLERWCNQRIFFITMTHRQQTFNRLRAIHRQIYCWLYHLQ